MLGLPADQARLNYGVDLNEERENSRYSGQEYDRSLLAAAIASAKQQQYQPRQYYATDENQQLSSLVDLSDFNPLYSSSEILSQLASSGVLNSNIYDNNDKRAEYKDFADDLSNDDEPKSRYGLRIGRSDPAGLFAPSKQAPAAYMSTNDFLLDDNNNQQSPLILDQIEPLEPVETLDEESSANLAFVNSANRAKPIVSTLVDDENSLSAKEAKQKDNKVAHETIGPGASIGRVIERESDRTNKEASPSWQLFLSRIYESVFGAKPDQESGPKVDPTTTAAITGKINAEKQHNEKHTKPSEVSSDQIQTNNSNKSTQTKQNTIAKTTTSRKDLATNGRSDDLKNNNNDNNHNDKLSGAIKEGDSEQQRDKKTVESDKKSTKFVDVVEKVMENNRAKHSHDVAAKSHAETYNSAQDANERSQNINLMRKSTLVLPIDDLNDDDDERIEQFLEQQQQQQSTPTLYAAGTVYPWANNNINGDLSAYKAFSRRYHPGQPIFGFAPQVMSTQPSGFTYRSPGHGNDLYFLVMVGAFCVMAVAMVLAAGLFAYRVQQNRKSSTEMDYPTYGVVGPNSVAGGKLGASGHGFVGGYFASNNAQAFAKGFTMNHNKGSNADLSNNNNTINSKNNIGGSSENGFHSPNDSGIVSSMSGSAHATSSAAGGKTTVLAGASKRSPSDSRPPTFMASQQNAARIYHYQHQKQQMISSERNSSGRHTSASDLDSEEENEDGNYTVYECPGLASAHDMEIKNPLFNDDRSP